MKKKISIIMLFLLSLFVGINGYDYFSLKNKSNERIHNKIIIDTDQRLDLLGLMDSYGVNYHPSVSLNFQDILEEVISKKGKLTSSLNLFNLYCNKTWELDGLFANGVTLREFSDIQNYSLDFTRHKYGDEHIRNDLVYTIPVGQKDVTIREYMKNLSHPIILYSCTANDLFYYFNLSLESVTYGKVLSLIQGWPHGLDLLKSEVIHNIDTLVSCNSSSQIFVMGLYVPTDNFFLQRLGTPFVNAVNGKIESVCELYDNVYYVDCSSVCFSVLDGDFHPNAEGQYQIAAALSDSINKNLKEFTNEHSSTHDFVKEQELYPVPARVSASEIWMEMLETNLPISDYVEFSVAFEQALLLLEMEDLSVEELMWIETDFDTVLNGKELQMMKQALDIIITERKIHRDFDLKQYSLVEDIHNDKLSLISYYRK